MLSRALVFGLVLAPAARAQFQVDSYSIDSGGGKIPDPGRDRLRK